MSKFGLVLLATSALAGENGGVNASPIQEAEWFVANLRWYYMKPGKLLLTWDVPELIDRNVDEIRVRARPTSGANRIKKAGASVENGNVTLEKLLLDTLYLMGVKGYANGTLIFGSISLIKTRPSAPSHIQRPEGGALSSTRIQLRWSRPTHPNGILNPYRVTCFDVTRGSTPVNATTNNVTTSVIINNLRPKTVYKCSVVASTVPGAGQNPKQCERRSELSLPIRTPPIWVARGENMSVE
ncbi:Ephrin type-A receptor 7 [Taenia solium]|eukprot:TsM_001066600 transcript=TsM_001066600 gene=TsM_001066600